MLLYLGINDYTLGPHGPTNQKGPNPGIGKHTRASGITHFIRKSRTVLVNKASICSSVYLNKRWGGGGGGCVYHILIRCYKLIYGTA